MKIAKTNVFDVSPRMPKKLVFLDTLKENIWWSWQHDAVHLLSSIDRNLWKKAENNLKHFLNSIPQETIKNLAENTKFIANLNSIEERYKEEVESKIKNRESDLKKRKIAYFSLEYGIHESLKLYSGGLGVLAGDHLKAASDLSIPMVAVGLLYKEGYFIQRLDKDGWQYERYSTNRIQEMPMSPAKDETGKEVKVKLPLLDRELTVAAWVLNVGNVPLILLDTNLADNPDDLRDITARLYGGDQLMRLHQELVLAVAGYQVLLAMGYNIEVCHINEGHAAFLSFARIGELVNQGVCLQNAIELVWASNIFTTHTPVPAGNETFPVCLLRPYLEALEGVFKMNVDELLAMGMPPNTPGEEFSMTVLGLRMSYFSNGVSRLHGEVARGMWSYLWHDLPKQEIPITSVTNGVHVYSWLSPENQKILDEYLSDHWHKLGIQGVLMDEVSQIPEKRLWEAREQERAILISHTRACLKKQLLQRNASNVEIALVKQVLNPNALTIGFARRFATYKRATLLLRDKDRLAKILKNKQYPVQVVFAGKAHPADDGGKKIIQEIFNFIEEYNLKNQIVFVEDYDIELGRYMTQGVDVWLNNPLRPMEASGTSGMKAAINGALNCSILDGWWEEGYEIESLSGWAIRNEATVSPMSQEEVDDMDACALYTLLENEIIPKFYKREEDDIPYDWVKMMKASMGMSLHNFSSSRMVSEYYDRFYQPSLKTFKRLWDNDLEEVKKLVAQKEIYIKNGEVIKIEQPHVESDMANLFVGDKFKVETQVYLGDVSPEEVIVEVYYGMLNYDQQIMEGKPLKMNYKSKEGEGLYTYELEMEYDIPGRVGITARVKPSAEIWGHYLPPFIKWAE